PSRAARLNGLRRFVRSARPDLVVSFLSYLSVVAAVRLANVGSRVIFNLQTPMSAFLTDRDYHWRRPSDRLAFAAMTRIGYRLADRVVATSRGVADDLVQRFGVDQERIRVVHNPIDLDAIAKGIVEPIAPEHDS